MHETTRRRLCRAGFLALCVVPTCLAIGRICWLRQPQFKRAQEQALGECLGLDVSLARVTFPRPGIVDYEGLELAEPETHLRLARARLVEVQRHGDALVIDAHQGEINGEHLDDLRELVRRLMRGASAAEGRLIVRAGEVTCRFGGGSARTFTEVRGELESSATSPHVSVGFRLAGADMPEAAEIHLRRNRQMTPPATRFELDTKRGSLPCWLVSSLWPAAERLGKQSLFHGRLWAEESAAGWTGEVTGHLAHVDLGALIAEGFGHKLSGLADVTLHKTQFHCGRLDNARGWVTAGPGVIGRSLLSAAVDHLHFRAGAESKNWRDSLPYRQLAFSFEIDDRRGLVIQAEGDRVAPRAVLVDSAGALLWEPPNEPQPAVNLVRMLAPASEVLVPATRETDLLTHVLPIPPIVRPPGADRQKVNARLKGPPRLH